jgi:predicted RNA-binding Zn-ribbon protein involved in translation (DUF1610 family)
VASLEEKMAGENLALSITLTAVDCGQCGGSYAINERYREQCKKYGRSWTCPYCQTGWGFSGNGDFEKLQKQLESERRLREQERLWKEQAVVRERAARGQATRLRNRAAAGVCPCCNRTFKQLAAHMKAKHPKYGADSA